MKEPIRVRLTIFLVVAGIVLGYLSYGTKKLGLGEIFPFADWRLYSAPIGINEPAVTYRIYTRDENSHVWKRQQIESTRAYSRKEYGYILGYWTRRVLEDDDGVAVARDRLRLLAESLYPDNASYRIVAESFYSFPVLADSSRYDTSTVARFTR